MTGDGNKPPEIKEFRKAGTAGGNGSAQRAAAAGAGVSRVFDRISLSGRAREIRDLVDAVNALPDVRLDKVAAVRKAIESGTYRVDASKIAQKMIDEIR